MVLDEAIDPKVSSIVGISFSENHYEIFIASQDTDNILVFDL